MNNNIKEEKKRVARIKRTTTVARSLYWNIDEGKMSIPRKEKK
jgi:hypothetical protein